MEGITKLWSHCVEIASNMTKLIFSGVVDTGSQITRGKTLHSKAKSCHALINSTSSLQSGDYKD